MKYEQIRQMLLQTAEAIIESKPYLTEIDSAIGDGDHGVGMALGMGKAVQALNACCGSNPYELFSEMGKAMLMSMGGASGVIFGTMFIGGARGKAPTEDMTAGQLAEFFRDSMTAIQKRGGAQPGDKTMIDALAPAVDAMEQTADQGICAMLAAAEEAAAQGVEATKNFVAKFGRAKSLMERSLGHQDAGATSVLIIFRAMHKYCEEMS